MSTTSDSGDGGGSTSAGSASHVAATPIGTDSRRSCQLRTLLGSAVAVAPADAIDRAEATAADLVHDIKILPDEQAGAEAIALLVQNPMITIPTQVRPGSLNDGAILFCSDSSFILSPFSGV